MRILKTLALLCLTYSLNSFTCEGDCITVNYNQQENLIMVIIEGTASGETSSFSITNAKGEIVVSENIKLQNERTVHYIDLDQIIMDDGEYQFNVDKITYTFSLNRIR